MYRIDKTNYGFKITINGEVELEEIYRFYTDSERQFQKSHSTFGVMFDLRHMRAVSPQTMRIFINGQSIYRKLGMKRSVMIFYSQTKKRRAMRLGKAAGVNNYLKFIDATTTSNWQKAALNWLKHGIDPNMTLKEKIYSFFNLG